MPLSHAGLIARVTLLPGADRFIELHRRELPQRDELCGPFAALLALRAAGVRGSPLDQDAVAIAAGTVLSPPPRDGSLPPGEPGRADFRLPLPQAEDPSGAGTSAHGLATAIEQLSGGALAAVPAAGMWDAQRLHRLLHALITADGTVAVLANVATAQLCDPGADPADLLRYLETGSEDAVPRQRWNVGHFVTLLGVLDGSAGSLVLVADTYRSLGVDGLHLQPLPRLAAALRRDGLPPGGVLLAARAARRESAAEIVRSCGLREALWDNGSPAPVARS